MSKKKFLMPKYRFDIEENGRPRQVRSCIPKCFLVTGMIFISGSIILGLSIHGVAYDSVGFYTNEAADNHYRGVYLEVPWKKEKMQTVKTENNFVEINNFVAHSKDGYVFTNVNIILNYNVTDMIVFVRSIKDCGGTIEKFNDRLRRILQSELYSKYANKTMDDIFTEQPPTPNLSRLGIDITSMNQTPPVLLRNIDVVERIDYNERRINGAIYDLEDMLEEVEAMGDRIDELDALKSDFDTVGSVQINPPVHVINTPTTTTVTESPPNTVLSWLGMGKTN